MNARVTLVISVFLSIFISQTVCPHSKTVSFSAKGFDTDLKKEKKERKSKKLSGKKKKNKVFTDMTYEELKVAQKQQLEKGNTNAAMKYLERMLKMCTNITELASLMVEYSDMLFDAGKFETAGTLYTEFTRLYPGHEKTEYSLHRAIMCCEYSTLQINRDQSKTHETIALADEFLQRDTFTTYRKEVKKIRSTCFAKLIESELSICDYYLKRGNTKAVDNRLKTLRADYLPQAPEAESLVIAFELQVSEKKGEDVAQHFAKKAGVKAEEITRVASVKKPQKAVDRF